MQMAQSAGLPFVGVSWGYHPVIDLTGAVAVLDAFEDLDAVLDNIWKREQ
jgi:phosphoglycolate phosphatase